MRNNATTGGGMFAQDCAQAILYNNVLTQNQANGSGGAIFQVRQEVELSLLDRGTSSPKVRTVNALLSNCMHNTHAVG